MKEWWFNLNIREKQIVSLGVIVGLAASLYSLIWSPLNNAIISLRHQVQHNQQLLSWLQTANEQIKIFEQMTQKAVVTHNAGSWLSIVQNSLKQSPIANNITQLAQADHDSIKLTFEQVDFDLLMIWLTQLWQQQGLIVTQLTITSAKIPGIVTAEYILKPA
ncbi:MAG: hypothetical protein K0S27_773 [Gammaproteobacteria bacterium]|jgi:general secretion pathway protein M|nr:hypothetical protein [Gammaproteobacteria bacterium]